MALIGAIIGDIIGSQYEFPSMRPDNLDWQNCPLLTDECGFTDDTVMSIATKIAIEKYDCNFAKAYKEFGKLYPNVEYGGMFARWLTGEIDNYASFGNGSAMRVSYVADCVQEINSVINLASASAECTHGSQSGILAAVLTACVIVMAKVGCSKEDIFQFTNMAYKEHAYDCSESLERLRDNYKWCDFADHTVPIAIRCFLDSTDYESCMRNCFSLDCDMDTMCCIAGGIAEAYYGTTGLDNKTILRKYLTPHLYECIKDLLEQR